MDRQARAPLELWGGVECTVNRVGNAFRDQLQLTGHAGRPEDLELLARLGVKRLRYPVLWERTAPGLLEAADWRWADQRLTRLQELGIQPILGLVHHGSGPRHTDLLDPGFAPGLAAFARAVARRYPWVADFTPVNEPLTTARFSALYGHWYPHARDNARFLRAVVLQCRAVVLAMRAIREVTPEARLVQTEDLGTVSAPPALEYQAVYENLRRWLSLDLLAGRLEPAHPLYAHLREHGITDADLQIFREGEGQPDVVGINYYATSDRFLDPRLEHYPPHLHGGNGRDAYADVEAVRVCTAGITGHAEILRLAWERYRLPVALTEVHLGGHREQALRWFQEAWLGAQRCREAGGDVRAVTAWSLLGCVDWDSLLTQERHHYEPGAFDVRSGAPQPTALAHLLEQLGHGRPLRHPVLHGPGWWRSPRRLAYPRWDNGPAEPPLRHAPAPLLVTGGSGTLGRALAEVCAQRDIRCVVLHRAELDIANPDDIQRALDRWRPWAILNAAGYVRVDDAEQDARRCHRENTVGPARLAERCRRAGVHLVTFSSDLVFDGGKRAPYQEQDAVAPLNVYGASKAVAERCVLRRCPDALVVRTSAFFGPWDRHNFLTRTLRELAAGARCPVANDAVVSPTYVPDLAHAVLDLVVDHAHGVWHLANRGETTWSELARRAAELGGQDARGLVPCPAVDLGTRASRPAYSVLGTRRGLHLPALEDCLQRYLRERVI